MPRQIILTGALTQLGLVPLVAGEDRAAHAQGGVHPRAPQQPDGIESHVHTLARGQSAHHGDPEGVAGPPGTQRLQRPVRSGDSVMDHLRTRGQARLGVQERVAGRPGVRHDPRCRQKRGVEPGADDPTLGVLGLVHMGQHRDACRARGHRPPGDRHRVGEDRLGAAGADDCPQAGDLRGCLRGQLRQTCGAQQGLAQDREGHDGHAGAGVAQHPDQGSVLGQSHQDLVTGLDESVNGLHQLPVRAVQVGGGVGHEDSDGTGAGAARPAPVHQPAFPVRRPEGRWRTGPSRARRRARAS